MVDWFRVAKRLFLQFSVILLIGEGFIIFMAQIVFGLALSFDFDIPVI